jgi:hypothetical protein
MSSQEALSASEKEALKVEDLVSIPPQQLAHVPVETWQVTKLSQSEQDAKARDDVVIDYIAAEGIWARLAQDRVETVCALTREGKTSPVPIARHGENYGRR